jgi:Protein of unknown function (DUF4019)
MKNLFSVILATLVLLGVPVRAQDSDVVAKAQAAALSWLVLTDSGAYSESWEQAAGLFQAAVPKTTWVNSIKTVRSPLGSLKSRKLRSATFTRSVPGAPTGEYVIIQYETEFEQKPNLIETVTPLRERDGSWKVSGYYIK